MFNLSILAFISSLSCSILCMKTLLKLLQHHSMYKDVFREVGLLEVMGSSLHRYAALLKEPFNGTGDDALPACYLKIKKMFLKIFKTLLLLWQPLTLTGEGKVKLQPGP